MKTDSNEIALIAACLADNYCSELYSISFGDIDALDVISKWTHWFYLDYGKEIRHWEKFEASRSNIYKAVCWEDFLIAWGADQLKQFKQKH